MNEKSVSIILATDLNKQGKTPKRSVESGKKVVTKVIDLEAEEKTP